MITKDIADRITNFMTRNSKSSSFNFKSTEYIISVSIFRFVYLGAHVGYCLSEETAAPTVNVLVLTCAISPRNLSTPIRPRLVSMCTREESTHCFNDLQDRQALASRMGRAITSKTTGFLLDCMVPQEAPLWCGH